MKSLDTANLYEVLDVAPGARPEEIERAYRMASATWAEGSLALYSLFEDKEAAVVRERLRYAYRILSDADSRRTYDEETFDSLPEGPPAEPAAGELADADFKERADDVELSLDAALEGSLAGDSEQDDEFDGPRLRRLRMHRGLDLDEIADITKVNSKYLRCIEEEAFDGLPAPVYVRGFVSAYAQTIGLNPQRVVASYMLRLEEGTKESDRAHRERP